MPNPSSWSSYLTQQINTARQEQRYRSLQVWDSLQPGYLVSGQNTLLNLSSNDYLGLCADPLSMEEASLLGGILPAGASASRLITGTLAIHTELEKLLAEWKGAEAALVYPSGYQTNLGLITALAGKGDAIFSDRLNHASIVDGCLLSGAKLCRYAHGDMDDLEGQLKATPGQKRLIVTDGLFSMDGDIAPLPRLNELAREYDALLIVDEAHATGTLGKAGAGSWAHSKLKWHDQVVLMGTLSKAVGAQGGFVCGSRALIEYLVNYSRSFIYSTSLSPLLAAMAHYNIVRIRDENGRLKSLLKNIQTLRKALRQQGLDIRDDPTPIIPVVIGNSAKTLAIAERLREKHIVAWPIRPPTVPEGTSRLRISVCATHDPKDLKRAAKTIGKVLEEMVG